MQELRRYFVLPSFVISLCTLLIACDTQPSIKRICARNPDICQGLNRDGWCQEQRDVVIKADFAVENSNRSEPALFDALIAWESYRTCIELAAQVEMKQLKIRQSRRVEGYIKAEEMLLALNEETRNAKMPELLWYHWTRNQDKEAYQRFIAYEDAGLLNTPELQLNLAAHYAQRDQEKTISILLRVLSMYDDNSQIDQSIFTQLATLTYQLKDYRHSYVWTEVTKQLAIAPVNMGLFDDTNLLTIQQKAKAKQIATQIVTDLNEGKFIAKRTYSF
ncbi:DUF2989 domain-containing protein [Neiella marina]|uniref:DUF2989 domain-containing protein n=1 Tax=Neiella holothuriorum TaxID=2870530 RepID=A0ABS7EGV2_9GAMM|nr:DUF2989 domain-containing protein [Neiella holothuriorum]MBW8191548.1 DUF2989 domain-containing protein [Neiella holothuriorum]